MSKVEWGPNDPPAQVFEERFFLFMASVKIDCKIGLTLKLAGYFAKHIQARRWGGGGFVKPSPRILKRLIISTCPLACN